MILEYLEGNFVLQLLAGLSVWLSGTCLILLKLIEQKVTYLYGVTGSVSVCRTVSSRKWLSFASEQQCKSWFKSEFQHKLRISAEVKIKCENKMWRNSKQTEEQTNKQNTHKKPHQKPEKPFLFFYLGRISLTICCMVTALK